MSNPRPESRIKSLEKRATDIEADIEELSSDQAEEFKAIRQDIKELDQGIKSSYLQIGDTFTAMGNDIKQGLAELKAAQDARFDKIEATQEQILKLLQQKP
jgi:chromosome segregation ATPase